MSAKKKKWKNKSAEVVIIYDLTRFDFRCEECDCQSFSFCDELQPDGSYASGTVKRCHNCKHLQ